MAERGITLVWTIEAKQEIQELYQRIAVRDKPAAKRVVAKIRQLAEQLVEHPEIGRIVPEYGVQSVRERIWKSYRIVYHLTLQGIEIIAIWHTAQLQEP